MTASNGSSRSHQFDLVLFGATGFTGRLVAEYLLQKRSSLRWALAGRSRDRLERVRDELAAFDAAARELPLITGDALDPVAMDALVRQTRVVCSTAGPYARYGSGIVAACAAHGVDYCDLTGETQWIRAMIDAHHGRAAETGARVVHCCGFDSIPSDLGVLLLHEHFARRGGRLAEARYSVMGTRGGMSGGSLASVLEAAEQAKDPAVRRLMADPYALAPTSDAGRPDARRWLAPSLDPDTDRWSGPFIMALVNERIVHRSNALLGFPYGRGFQYEEGIDIGAGSLGFAGALSMSALLYGAFAALKVPAVRALASRLLPPGQGPSRKEREAGYFHVELRGRSEAGDKAVAKVAARRDPGYGATAVMLAESALCLSEDELPARGGVLTPASAMGMHLVERLRTAGLTFAVE